MNKPLRYGTLFGIALLCVWALFQWVYRPYACMTGVAALGSATAAARGARDYDAPILARQNLAVGRTLEEKCRTCIRVYPYIAANEEIVGRHDDALQTYRRGLEVLQLAEMHHAIGTILLETGRTEEALDELTTAVRFNPNVLPQIVRQDIRESVEQRIAAARRKVK